MNNKNDKIYIVDAVRTPIGKLYGALSNWRADDLMVTLVDDLRLRTGSRFEEQVDSFLVGCSNQGGADNRNLARRIVLLSQLGVACNGVTLNSLCASGIDAILDGIRLLALGEADVVLAGGVETGSRAPYIRDRHTNEEVDSTIGWRFVNPKMSRYFNTDEMSKVAEQHAFRAGISRLEQDAIAAKSRAGYEAGLAAGFWAGEIVPLLNKKGKMQSKDEQHRLLSPNLLAKLPAVVPQGEFITSANAARIGDGAALVLLATKKGLERLGLDASIAVEAWATTAVHPDEMCLAAAAAGKKVLAKAGLSAAALDWVELSESFAVQRILCTQALGLDPEKVNPYGGALAIGNPTAMGSSRQVVSLFSALSNLAEGAIGMATTSAGLGVGSALILKRINR